MPLPKPPKPIETPPVITEPFKWFGYHLTKDWRIMMQAPIAFTGVFVFSLAASWLLTWNVVVPEKDTQLATKQEIIDQKQSDIESLSKRMESAERENDKLRSELSSSQTGHDEKTFPLKRRAQILAKQLTDFAAEMEADNSRAKFALFMNEWNIRFPSKMDVILRELDEHGFYSEKIETNNVQIYQPDSAKQIRDIASEIKRMADELPETEVP